MVLVVCSILAFWYSYFKSLREHRQAFERDFGFWAPHAAIYLPFMSSLSLSAISARVRPATAVVFDVASRCGLKRLGATKNHK